MYIWSRSLRNTFFLLGFSFATLPSIGFTQDTAQLDDTQRLTPEELQRASSAHRPQTSLCNQVTRPANPPAPLSYQDIESGFASWKQHRFVDRTFYTRLIERVFHTDRLSKENTETILRWLHEHPTPDSSLQLAHRLFQELLKIYPAAHSPTDRSQSTEEIFRPLNQVEILWTHALTELFKDEQIPVSAQADLLMHYPIEQFMGTPLYKILVLEGANLDLLNEFFDRLKHSPRPPSHGQYVFLLTYYIIVNVQNPEIVDFLHDHSLLKNTDKPSWPSLLRDRITRSRVAQELMETNRDSKKLGARAILALTISELRDPNLHLQTQLKIFFASLIQTVHLRTSLWTCDGIPQNTQDLVYSGGLPILMIQSDGTLLRGERKVIPPHQHLSLPPLSEMKTLHPIPFIGYLNPYSELGTQGYRIRNNSHFPYLQMNP